MFAQGMSHNTINRRRSLGGVAFVADSLLSKDTPVSGVATGIRDKENHTNSPHVSHKKKRKGRVSFAGEDTLLLYDKDETPKTLSFHIPPSKKQMVAATPKRKRASIAVMDMKLDLMQVTEPSPTDEQQHILAKDAPQLSDHIPEESQENSSSTTPAEAPMELEEDLPVTPDLSVNALESIGEIDTTTEREFTLDDVLAQGDVNLDMAALNSAADDELSAIYATGSNKSASLMGFLSLEGQTEANISTTSKQTEKEAEEAEEVIDEESTTSGWGDILTVNRRDSLSLPSLARRDSFSLLSNRHLRNVTSPDEKQLIRTPLEQSLSVSTSKKAAPRRRDSLAMEMTISDLSSIIVSQDEPTGAEDQPEAQTITLASISTDTSLTPNTVEETEEDLQSTIRSFSKNRRSSLAMDMTHTDIGSIISGDDQQSRKEDRVDAEDLQEPASTSASRRASLSTTRRGSIVPRRRDSNIMDMTITDVGTILEARNDDAQDSEKRNEEDEAAEQTIRMDLTRTDLGAILDMGRPSETINLRSSITFKNRRQSLAMEETASNFGAILQDQQADESSTTTTIHKRRQSLAMEETASNFGAILQDQLSEEDSSSTTTAIKKRRQSLAMEETISNFGAILQDQPTEESVTTMLKKRRQSLAMEETASNFGAILQGTTTEDSTTITLSSRRNRRQSLAMEETMSNFGTILQAANDEDEQASEPSTATTNKNRRQSLAMEETISNFGAILEDNEVPQDSSTTDLLALPTTASLIENESNDPIVPIDDQTTDLSIMQMTTPLETAAERASKPASNLFSLLTSAPSNVSVEPSATASSAVISFTPRSSRKLRRESVAMDFSTVSFGGILQDEQRSEHNEEASVQDVTDMEIEQASESAEIEDVASETFEDIQTPDVTSTSIPVLQSPAASSKDAHDDVEADMEMELTQNLTANILASEAATEEDMGIATPVNLSQHENVDVSTPTVVQPITSTPVLAQKETPTSRTNNDDVLFSDVVSITSSFPNLSMSISSRNMLKSAMIEAASGQELPATELPSTLDASTSAHSATFTSISLPAQVLARLDSTPVSEEVEVETEKEIPVEEEASLVPVDDNIIEANTPDRRSSLTRRLSLLDHGLDGLEEIQGMSEAELDNYLAQDTRLLAASSLAKGLRRGPAALFALPSGSPGATKAMMSVDSVEQSSRAPMLSALQQAVPAVVPTFRPHQTRQQFQEPAPDAQDMDVDDELDTATMSSLGQQQHSDTASQLMDEDALEDEEDLAAISEENSARLEAIQRDFEAHIESQLRTPGIRKSLLTLTAMTPAPSSRRGSYLPYGATNRNSIGGRLSIISASESPVAISGASPSIHDRSANHSRRSSLLSTASGMHASSTATLTSIMSNTSLARFMSSFGVNFMDGMASRRQSLGVRVPEPRGEFDRMVAVMRSEPELDLLKRLFASSNAMIEDCEHRLAELEASCRQQCSQQIGIYNLFSQAITTHQSSARKDLANLKLFATLQAKTILNERTAGRYFEEQLFETLQIIVSTAKSYLNQLEEQQAATITSKLKLVQHAHKPSETSDTPQINAQSQVSSTNSIASTEHALKDAQRRLEESTSAESLCSALQGWRLSDSTESCKVFDFRNAVELVIDMKQGYPDQIENMRVSCILAAKTEKELEERAIMEKLISSISCTEWIGSRSLTAAMNGVATRVGRLLDLTNEIRLLSRSFLFESIESVAGEGVSITIRFFNAQTGVRFLVKLVVDERYPFAPILPFELDARFARVTEGDIAEIFAEETDANGWKLLTRVCKRLDRLCN